MPPSHPSTLERVAPPLFVVIWATGFIVARLVAPHAEPLTFLTTRYVLTILVLGGAALALRAPWPCTARGWRNGLVAGMLLHGAYLGGVFWSVRHGLPAGISALIAGMQPLMTAVLSGPLLGEPVSGRRWLGIGMGFAGVVLVLAPKLGAVGGLPPLALAVCFGAMVSITLGTIWQKRTAAGVDLRTNAVVQFLGALLVTLPVAALLEEGRVDGSADFWIGLLWAVFGLSIGGISLLLMLIRRGAVAGVASLLYLVPPVSAVMAFFLFGESLTAVQILGMALAAVGVAVASRA
ncbi:DMT family transporter [Chelatococcus sp. SYSU_G07232]|uniref:DMT family transporter n=1 Tax=Chelatococcus albus TaxID=3047466 RepID=A0ABT7ADH2_9HYPH|nr:DMT family transporter [Chelatococcus sp. SYSU_G07232]MDJ1157427.1 DMT family transporter [Chelatococcus sp. SYSU_G07232]